MDKKDAKDSVFNYISGYFTEQYKPRLEIMAHIRALIVDNDYSIGPWLNKWEQGRDGFKTILEECDDDEIDKFQKTHFGFWTQKDKLNPLNQVDWDEVEIISSNRMFFEELLELLDKAIEEKKAKVS